MEDVDYTFTHGAKTQTVMVPEQSGALGGHMSVSADQTPQTFEAEFNFVANEYIPAMFPVERVIPDSIHPSGGGASFAMESSERNPDGSVSLTFTVTSTVFNGRTARMDVLMQSTSKPFVVHVTVTTELLTGDPFNFAIYYFQFLTVLAGQENQMVSLDALLELNAPLEDLDEIAFRLTYEYQAEDESSIALIGRLRVGNDITQFVNPSDFEELTNGVAEEPFTGPAHQVVVKQSWDGGTLRLSMPTSTNGHMNMLASYDYDDIRVDRVILTETA